MKSNALLKWLMIPVAVVVMFILLKTLSGHKDSDDGFDDTPKLTAEEMKALGIEGDTPRDTVATLVGQVKLLRAEMQVTTDTNKAQRTEIERLRQREADIDQKIGQALQHERDRIRQESGSESRQGNADGQTAALIEDMQRRIHELGQNREPGIQAITPDIPVGLGLEDGDAPNAAIVWIEPSDARTQNNRASSTETSRFPTSFGLSSDTEDASLYAGQRIRHESYGGDGKTTSITPVYTVPANATLMGSLAMTALIGRVPVDGTVTDPYPFKILVGPDNLTANGIELPDVAGAVFSGTASGDWTLSCVRGEIHSITFVFHDGTIRTIPQTTAGSSRSSRGSSNSLGWISDSYGIPCVAGQRRSNAQQYLGTQALITAAGAGAASLVKDDDGSFSYMSSDGSMGQVGISGNEAVGQILMGGVRDMSQWINKLYGQAFAAVYVEPGAQVAIHIDEALDIDYDASGRKVDHNLGENYARELD
ncbi:TIGR03752 family integrating conjugative element protein [Saezia sanguinis]|uniref:TIGR03752 family integrating conjugative element protein n=1 Tax=Saezia sanguinis TaxID=1965230 RepID=UPI00306D03BB